MAKTKYNDDEKRAFIHGAVYGMATVMKRDGLFEDLTTDELVKLLTIEALKEANNDRE